MSTKNVTAATATTKPSTGFGIKKETRGTGVIKFNPNPAEYDGLCLGGLKEVVFTTSHFKDDQKGDFAEFAGKDVPTLNFVFEGIAAKKGSPAPIYVHSYKMRPIVPNDNYAWQYDAMFQTIKHLIDVYTADQFLDAYEDLLVLNIDLENGMPYEALEAAWKSFFEGVVIVFNGDGDKLPCIFKTNGEIRLVWMKLLRYNVSSKGKESEVNGGDPGFTLFPGEGLIELYDPNFAPTLRINIAKGESIIPKERKANAPSAPAPTTAGTPSTAGTAGAAHTANSAVPGFMRKGGQQ